MASRKLRTTLRTVGAFTTLALTGACSGTSDAPVGGTPTGMLPAGAEPVGVTPGTQDPAQQPGGAVPTTMDPTVTMTPPLDTMTPGQTPDMTTPPLATDGKPPTPLCDGVLPGTFTSTCSGCHTSGGLANERYPDLFSFAGTLDQFRAKVRTGGNGMAPYGEAIIADADIDAIFAYFTGTARPELSAANLGGVVPLFTEADANTNPPIVFTRDDGVLVTRGAGRVRGRHEGPQDTNVPFMEFVTNYFESRSYGFIVEDHTPTGQDQIDVTYLPKAMPTGGTNFRAWKDFDNGDVFANNGGMQFADALPNLLVDGTDMASSYQNTIGEYAAIQHASTGTIRRDLFEFEFGIFIAEVTPPGSRTAYYTDTFRYKVGQGGLTADSPDTYGGAGPGGPVPSAQLAGDTTNVWAYNMFETQFGQQSLNIQHEHIQHFLQGRRLFHTDFVTGEHSEEANPGFDEQAGKAGPLFATTACENCHINNGRGELLQGPLDETSSMAIKLYNAPNLGNQLQLQEGTADVASFEEKAVTLGDGTVVNLRKPIIEVTANDGSKPAFSARVARKVIGVGLLEAIDERTILARADALDCDGDGISGRGSFVDDPVTGELRLGRVGWKAEKVSVQHQVADAAEADLGVGSSIIPDSEGNVELTDDELNDLTTYMRLVTVPAQRNFDDPQVMTGEQVFKTVGCSNCHVTDVVTGSNHPFRELQNQAIKPFTDLLLHDLGPDLADNSGVELSDDPAAPPAASEWRTSPLWGIGLFDTINGHTGLLHDGRAANVLEAVLWHGGEAEGVKQRFMALAAADREALLAFVQSL